MKKICITKMLKNVRNMTECDDPRRVSRGGQGAWASPIEIEKPKKRSSEQILRYFTYILLLFLVGNIIFSAIFGAIRLSLKN